MSPPPLERSSSQQSPALRLEQREAELTPAVPRLQEAREGESGKWSVRP